MAAKKPKLQGHSFSPVSVTRAASAFSCIAEGGNGASAILGAVGTGSVLLATSGELQVCDVGSRQLRTVVAQTGAVTQAMLLNGSVATPYVLSFVAGVGVQDSQAASLVLFANSEGWLIAAADQGAVRRVVSADLLLSPVVFLAASRVVEDTMAPRANAIVAVSASGLVRLIVMGSIKMYNVGVRVASCSCFGSVLAVCPEDMLLAPMLFDLANVPDVLVPRSVGPNMPACSALVLEDKRVTGLSRVGNRLVSRSFETLSKLGIACRADRPGAVRDAVQAIASQSIAQTALKEAHRRANSVLAELNGSVRLVGELAKDKAALSGVIEVRVHESGALALAVTVKNGSSHDLSSNWYVVAVVGDGNLYSAPLPRGIRAGATASVFVASITVYSYVSLPVKAWLMHQSVDILSSRSSQRPQTRFVAGPDLAALLCERRVSPLELCWEKRAFVRTAIARPPVTRCCLHASSFSAAAPSHSAARTFRLAVNSDYLNHSLATCMLDSAFGTAVSIQVKPSSSSLTDIIISCMTDSAEALAIRAAVLAKLLANLPAVEPRKPANDWRSVRPQLTALSQRLAECADADLPTLYSELRRLAAKIL